MKWWWLGTVGVLLGPGVVRASEPAGVPVEQPPAVSVFCWYSAELAYQAAVTYSPATVTAFGVTEAVAKADLARLAELLGYPAVTSLQRVKPGEGPQPFAFDRDALGLTLGFRVSEVAFNRPTGTFKLEAFVTAYRRYGRVDLDFMVTPLGGKAFAYRGLGNYDSRQVMIRHHGSGGSQSFRIAVLDPTAEAYDLPPFAPPVLPLSADSESDKESGPDRLKIIMGVVASGLSVAAFLLVYWGLRRWDHPQRRRRRGR